MFCENCGKELNNDVVFCKYCGAKVDDVNEANSNDKSNGNINVNNVPLNNKSQPVIENKGSKAKIIIQIVSATVVVIGIVVLLVVLLSSTKSFYEELIDKADNIAYKRYDKDYVDIKKSIGTAEYSCTSKDTSSRGKVDYDYYITENKVNELKTILKKYIHRAKKEDIHFYDDDSSKSNVDEYNIDDYYDVYIVIYKDDIHIWFYRYDDGQDELALEIKIDNMSARSFGSQGQQRSCALALKLGESEIIKDITGENPVALLDDVISELDEKRQDYVLNHIKERQVFLTCCDPSQVLRLCKGKSFLIESGKIKEEK